MDEPGMVAERPAPEIEPHAEPFWRAAKQRRLLLPRCTDCQALQFPPELSCVHCGSPSQEWVEASGRATLYTWTLCHAPLLPYFAAHAPWAVAAVTLEEGVRMITRVVGIPESQYQMEMPLVADYEDLDDERTLVVFRPADDGLTSPESPVP
ncbi:MAG: OB-fold domain-containing protein [Deltaproteobacteria bacterium]|nr:OB-fold domain-containing protein [Deltaproteobacteria bacterium]